MKKQNHEKAGTAMALAQGAILEQENAGTRGNEYSSAIRQMKDLLEEELFDMNASRPSIDSGYAATEPAFSPLQKTTVEEIAQLLLAAIYQLPGSARTHKTTIFTNRALCDKLFGKERGGRPYDTAMVRDLIHAKEQYERWANGLKKEDDEEKASIAGNGKFFTIAIIGALARIHSVPDLLPTTLQLTNYSDRYRLLTSHDLSHRVFREGLFDEDGRQALFPLFEYCYKNVLVPAVEHKRYHTPCFTTLSNFAKSDNDYRIFVLAEIWNGLDLCESSSGVEVLTSILYTPTNEERMRDLAPLEVPSPTPGD